MWYTRDSGEREKCILSIPVESCDSKVKLLKQFGRYFLIWFSKSFLLIINSLINTSKFLWASLLGKILIHESSSQTYSSVLSLGFKNSRRKYYASVCIWKDKVSLRIFLFLLQMHSLHAWHITSILQYDCGARHGLSNWGEGKGGAWVRRFRNRVLISFSPLHSQSI